MGTVGNVAAALRVLLLLEATPEDIGRVNEALLARGHQVTTTTHQAALDDPTAPELQAADLIISDVEIADRVQLVAKLATAAPGIEFILVGPESTAIKPADVIARLARPIDLDALLPRIDEVADVLDGERLREPIDLVAYETLFAGNSPQVLNLVRRVRLVARSEAPVWVVGDDGSGRAIIGRAIHDRSSRRNQPFLSFNAASLGDEQLSALLFEGETAAVERARLGTIFLEQISMAGPVTQRELLQFFDRSTDSPSARFVVGVQRSDAPSPQRKFSADLYFKLKVLEVEIPALKDRAADLSEIVARMLGRLVQDATPPAVAVETMHILERYSFPGNLLELAHTLTHAFVVAHGGSIQPHHLPASVRQDAVHGSSETGELESLDKVAKRFERDYLLRVLRSVDGNRGRAAEILGLSRKGLWGKLKAHGISDDDIGDQLDSDDDHVVRRS
jgi:DNA-binding NtrC family response regulator